MELSQEQLEFLNLQIKQKSIADGIANISEKYQAQIDILIAKRDAEIENLRNS